MYKTVDERAAKKNDVRKKERDNKRQGKYPRITNYGKTKVATQKIFLFVVLSNFLLSLCLFALLCMLVSLFWYFQCIFCVFWFVQSIQLSFSEYVTCRYFMRVFAISFSCVCCVWWPLFVAVNNNIYITCLSHP